MDSVIIFCSKYLFVFVVLLVIYAWVKTPRHIKPAFLITIIVSGIIALIISRIASRLYYDPRPFVTEHVKPLIAHSADNGFPSDHALLTGTLTTVTFIFSKKVFIPMLGLTVIVGVARILAKIHSPLDIGGGFVIAIVGTALGYYFMRWVIKRPLISKQLAKFGVT